MGNKEIISTGKINRLAELTPGETLFILQDKNASIRELLKVTFMDLLLKHVLRTFDVEKKPSHRDPVRTYKYVETGKNFLTYRPFAHELPFLIPFQTGPQLHVLFLHMVKIGYQNAGKEKRLHTSIVKSPKVSLCFRTTLIQKITGSYGLTAFGEATRVSLQSEIAHLEATLPDMLLNNHARALEIVRSIKGNIFLLKNIEFDLLTQIDKDLLTELNGTTGNRDSGAFGSSWVSFDSYSSTFDNSCSNDNGCSNSGCSGCGGAGCSGCGGCS